MATPPKEPMPFPRQETQDVCCPQCNTAFTVPIPPTRMARGHELTRRATMVMVDARQAAYGQLICPFCNRNKRGALALLNHLRREHFEELQDDMLYTRKPKAAC